MTTRRLLAFALVPLSAVPLAAGVPLVAPSVEDRVKELREEPVQRAAEPAWHAPRSLIEASARGQSGDGGGRVRRPASARGRSSE